jgi:DNA-binding XRE family transcriptional regulator
MTPDQCRQARELLKWTRQELASAANVTPWVIDAFEDGRDVLPSYVEAIRTALEAVGIGFPFELSNGRAASAGVTYSPRDRSETH